MRDRDEKGTGFAVKTSLEYANSAASCFKNLNQESQAILAIESLFDGALSQGRTEEHARHTRAEQTLKDENTRLTNLIEYYKRRPK